MDATKKLTEEYKSKNTFRYVKDGIEYTTPAFDFHIFSTEAILSAHTNGNIATKDLDAVVASIRNVDGVEVAMFLYQLSEDSYKVSLRSKNYVDVSKIAVENGGGGHVRAAGAEIHGELNDIINKLLNRIKQDI